MIPELSLTQWFVLAGSALAIGLSKTGLPGATIVAIPLLAQCFSAKASTGLVLPMLVCADLVAVSYYRRKADVSHLIHLIPWAALGVVIGSVWLGRIGDAQLMPLIGAIVLLMLGLNHWRRRVERPDAIVPRTWWLAGAVGLVAGITTMMANAAGPIMIVYFLAMRLPKESFVGTGAWYFFLLNLFKLPFSAHSPQPAAAAPGGGGGGGGGGNRFFASYSAAQIHLGRRISRRAGRHTAAAVMKTISKRWCGTERTIRPPV